MPKQDRERKEQRTARIAVRGGARVIPDASIRPKDLVRPNPWAFPQTVAQARTALRDMEIAFSDLLRTLRERDTAISLVRVDQLLETLAAHTDLDEETPLAVLDSCVVQPLHRVFECLRTLVAEAAAAEQAALHRAGVEQLLQQSGAHFARLLAAFHREVSSLQELARAEAAARVAARATFEQAQAHARGAASAATGFVRDENLLVEQLRATDRDRAAHGFATQEEAISRATQIEILLRSVRAQGTRHAAERSALADERSRFHGHQERMLQWAKDWRRKAEVVGSYARLFESAGVDPFQGTLTDRETLFTLPEHEEQERLRVSDPDTVERLEQSAYEARADKCVKDLLTHGETLPAALSPPAPAPAPAPAPVAVPPLHLVTSAFFLAAAPVEADRLFAALEAHGLTARVSRGVFRQAADVAIRRGFLAEVRRPGRQPPKPRWQITEAGRTTVVGCKWLDGLPAAVAEPLRAAVATLA